MTNNKTTKSSSPVVLDGAEFGMLHMHQRGDLAIGAHKAAQAIGWNPPAEVAAAVEVWHSLQERALNLPTPAPFTSSDLAADDWHERLATAAVDAATQERKTTLARAAADEAKVNVGTACLNSLQPLGDWLEQQLIEHLPDWALTEQATDTSESLARIERREASLAEFRRAHVALMYANTGSSQRRVEGDSLQWWILHTWTPEQWARLIDSTGPCTSSRAPMTLAATIGATPRLARTIDQAGTEWAALRAVVEAGAPMPELRVIGATW